MRHSINNPFLTLFIQFSLLCALLFAALNVKAEVTHAELALGDAGTLGLTAKNYGMASTIVDGDTLYVIWRGTGSNRNIYYSYYPAINEQGQKGWSESSLVGAQSGQITSYNHVDAVIFTPDPLKPDNKQVCLFTVDMHTWDNVLDEEILAYYCTKQYTNSVNGSAPQFLWSATQTIYPITPDLPATLHGTVSIKKHPDDDTSFYLVDVELSKTQNPPDYLIRLNKVTASSSGALKFEMLSSRVNAHADPVLLIAAPTTHIDEYFIFFNHLKQNNKVAYAGMRAGCHRDTNCYAPISQLIGLNNETRETKKREAVMLFEDNLYVAYKNKNNHQIRFSKISKTNWDSVNHEGVHGFGNWQHCQFETSQGAAMAQSDEGPHLFAYDGGLYLLYSNSNDGQRLTYQRIDNIDMDSGICNK